MASALQPTPGPSAAARSQALDDLIMGVSWMNGWPPESQPCAGTDALASK